MALRVHRVTYEASEPQCFEGYEGRIVRFGRGVQSDVRFDEQAHLVSTLHAEAEFSKGRWILRDTESRNGIFVDENPCKEMVLAWAHDVMFGPNGPRLRLEVVEQPSAVVGRHTTRQQDGTQQDVAQQDIQSVAPTRDGSAPQFQVMLPASPFSSSSSSWSAATPSSPEAYPTQRSFHAPSAYPNHAPSAYPNHAPPAYSNHAPPAYPSHAPSAYPSHAPSAYPSHAPLAYPNPRTLMSAGVDRVGQSWAPGDPGPNAPRRAVVYGLSALALAVLTLATLAGGFTLWNLVASADSNRSALPPEPQRPRDSPGSNDAPGSAGGCTKSVVILAGGPRNAPDSFAWDVTRQTLLSVPELTVVRGAPVTSGQIHLAAHRSNGGSLTLLADCIDATTCNRLAAQYKAIVRSSRPQVLCGDVPGMGPPVAEFAWSTMPSGNLPNVGNYQALCARINACLITSNNATPGDPFLECQRGPAKFRTDCAMLPSCSEVTSCLNGNR